MQVFELGQIVFYDILIFSLRKSAFIYCFFYKGMKTTLLPAIMGVGGRLRGMKPLFWLTICFNLTSALLESRMF